MIQLILELLKSDNFFGVSEIVDVAKGKHELTGNVKKIFKLLLLSFISNSTVRFSAIWIFLFLV